MWTYLELQKKLLTEIYLQQDRRCLLFDATHKTEFLYLRVLLPGHNKHPVKLHVYFQLKFHALIKLAEYN